MRPIDVAALIVLTIRVAAIDVKEPHHGTTLKAVVVRRPMVMIAQLATTFPIRGKRPKYQNFL